MKIDFGLWPIVGLVAMTVWKGWEGVAEFACFFMLIYMAVFLAAILAKRKYEGPKGPGHE